MGMAEFVPLQPTKLSFFEKMWELQYKMLSVNQENVQDHMYSSDPMDWPFLTRGIAYWVSPVSNAQIHLLGNLLIWYSASLSIVLYLGILVFYLLRRRRRHFDVTERVWKKFCLAGQVCLFGYALHFLPYFFADRTLFLHHYLPALLYKLLLLVTVVEHLDYLLCYGQKSCAARNAFYSALVVWLIGVLWVFNRLSVFSYGTAMLSAQEVLDLRWKDTWDFIIHRP